MQMDATILNIVAPRMLGIVASVLAVECKRMQQVPTMLGAAVHRGKDTMCDGRCWKSCAIAYNIVELRFGGHGTKEMLRVVGSKVSPVSKLTQQLPTSHRVT